jgi:mannose-6-phosphate isomerase-like protein (cupin superfamily)
VRRIEKPWGYEFVWAETDRYVAKLIHMRAGSRLSLQYHRVKDETMLLQSGEVELLLEEDDGTLVSRRLTAGVSVRIQPGRRHRLTAITDSDVIEVSTPELDDVVRLEDDHGRAGGGGGHGV